MDNYAMIYSNLNQYKHQLYFLSPESAKIRSYFEDLNLVDININNNTNVYQTQTKYNFEELAQKICSFGGHSEFYPRVLSMIKTDEALKVIVALLFKGFGWKNEIYESFNIVSSLYVQNTLSTLQSLSLVYKEDGLKINNIYYDALVEVKGTSLSKSLHQAQIYFINEDFITFCNMLIELFEFKARRSKSFRFSIQSIIEDSKRFISIINDVIEEELTLDERKKKDFKGIDYLTDTIKTKERNKRELQLFQNVRDVEIDLLEQKQQKKKLTQTEENQLVALNEKSNLIVKYQPGSVEKFRRYKKQSTFINGEYIGDDSKADLILKEAKERDKEIEESPTIIGKAELAEDEQAIQYGTNLARGILNALSKPIETLKNKSEDEKVKDLFESLQLK